MLQEATGGFFARQAPGSSYSLAASSGQCGVLVRSALAGSVTGTFNAALPSLTGCPLAPGVSLGGASFLSAHVEAGVEDMAAWFEAAAAELEKLGGPVVVGGDFNHNASEAGAPVGWRIAAPGRTAVGNGTSQHQDDWMGAFDGFFHTAGILVEEVEASTEGFMPKSVLGFGQGGEVRERSRFRASADMSALYWSEDADWGEDGDGGALVEGAGPDAEAMSDHLMVVARVEVEVELSSS
jgi:hypothetical protein